MSYTLKILICKVQEKVIRKHGNSSSFWSREAYGISTCFLGGLIPLHNACSFGHAEVVRLLLRHGADPNSRDNWNYTPLHEAAVKGKVDVCVGKTSWQLHMKCLLLHLRTSHRNKNNDLIVIMCD